MPRQLKYARRPKRSQPRPLAEDLPRINVNDLKIPKVYGKVFDVPWISFKYPHIFSARLSAYQCEFIHAGGQQVFRLKLIRTGYGLPRFAFICNQCGRPVITLYYRNYRLACRRCSNAIYASQVCGKAGRKALQSHRIQAFLAQGLGLTRNTERRLQARCVTNRPVRSKRITDKALRPQGRFCVQTEALPLHR
jgi:hypothetical protein